MAEGVLGPRAPQGGPGGSVPPGLRAEARYAPIPPPPFPPSREGPVVGSGYVTGGQHRPRTPQVARVAWLAGDALIPDHGRAGSTAAARSLGSDPRPGRPVCAARHRDGRRVGAGGRTRSRSGVGAGRAARGAERPAPRRSAAASGEQAGRPSGGACGPDDEPGGPAAEGRRVPRRRSGSLRSASSGTGAGRRGRGCGRPRRAGRGHRGARRRGARRSDGGRGGRCRSRTGRTAGE